MKEVDEEKRLELRLGPPSTSHGAKRGFLDTFEAKTGDRNWLACKSKVAEQQCHDQKKPCSSDPPNTDLSISSNKRSGQPSVVGWPPVQSFRKNLATSSFQKMASESSTKFPKEESGGKTKDLGSSLYVKINMDGIPIGRKIDLKAYDNYEKLSVAVDELFRGLLAAQGEENETQKREEIKGLLDGNGEYTLVYEDSEGDRILVGDVPWRMFISSAKRLRVLKRSELPSFHRENK